MTTRKLLSAVAVLLGLAVFSGPVAAQNVAGEWLFEVDLDAGSGEATFVFEVDGGEITGTYIGILGEQAVTGTIEGDVVRFGFEADDAGSVSFDGVIDGDVIEGECVYGLLGSGTFFGSRGE